MPRKLDGTYIQTGSITTTQLSSAVTTQISAGGGPKVSSLIYPGNDTAGNTVGGQTVYINGSGFETNNAIYINSNAVPSKSFISASNLSFTTPALSTGIYPVYVINTDSGATAIFVPGYISSAEPAWVTSAGSLSALQDEETAWSYSLSATGDAPVTYALAGGSSLPSGISLAANGVVSGTLSSPPGIETTYTFSVVATDAENQESTRQFTVSTTASEGVLFAKNVLLIHADGTNNKTNHTFLDSSNNNFTITRYGNATQGSFSPYSQTGWSGYFDGTGDYLNTSNNAAFTFGTGDLTIEGWIYQTATSTSTYRVIFGDNVYGSTGGYTLYSYNNALNLWKGGAPAAELIAPAGTITLNTWTHVAWTRSGSSNRLFINGTQVGATTTDATNYTSTASFIGASQSGTLPFAGYISNARILKGTALYTANSSPSTTPLTNIANTSLLTLQSNRFIDNSNNNFTITRNGDTSIQAFSPFAPTAAYSTANVGGSGYFDGTGDYLSWSGTTFSGDLTIECWLYKTAVESSGYTILFHNTNTAINHQFTFDGGTPGSIGMGLSGSTVITNSGTAIITNSWSHLAWVRQGSTFRAYVNGIQQGTGTSSESFNINLIGQYHFGGYDINGYISGLRMVNGTCLYPNGTTFTPPTEPPTNIANTSLLCNFTNAGIFDQTAKNILETVGDAKVSTAQYKYGTGSMVFDGTGDYLTIRDNLMMQMGSGDFTIEFWWYPNSIAGYQTPYDKGYTGSGGLLLQTGNGDGRIIVYANGSSVVTSNTAVTVNNWTHMALVRNSTSLTLYQNGVSVGSATNSTNFSNTSITGIGGNASGGVGYPINGYIDDLRITKGYARYTATFTPPTAALKDK